jgi:hypothetical protein
VRNHDVGVRDVERGHRAVIDPSLGRWRREGVVGIEEALWLRGPVVSGSTRCESVVCVELEEFHGSVRPKGIHRSPYFMLAYGGVVPAWCICVVPPGREVNSTAGRSLALTVSAAMRCPPAIAIARSTMLCLSKWLPTRRAFERTYKAALVEVIGKTPSHAAVALVRHGARRRRADGGIHWIVARTRDGARLAWVTDRLDLQFGSRSEFALDARLLRRLPICTSATDAAVISAWGVLGAE